MVTGIGETVEPVYDNWPINFTSKKLWEQKNMGDITGINIAAEIN